LLQIKRGEVPLDKIIEDVEKEISGLKELYDNSNLPEEVDPLFVKELLLNIRKYKEPIKTIGVSSELTEEEKNSEWYSILRSQICTKNTK